MPKLITDRPGAKSVRKKSGVRFSVPHSPFQKLIDARRMELDLSIAALAKMIRPSLHRGSLWIWLHNENGYPAKRSCTPARMKSISAVLDIPLPQLQQALDASRTVYSQQQVPVPSQLNDALGELISILEKDPRDYVTKNWVLNMAKRLRESAIAEISRTP